MRDNKMVKSYKISTLGKIIAIAASIIMIVLVTGKWLNLYQIPMIFGDSVQHEYSIFEITDLDSDDVSLYSGLLTAIAAAIIILGILNVIFTLLNIPAIKITTIASLALCVILTIIFVGTVQHINSEVKEATYGGISELLRTTSNPYWIVIISFLSFIGTKIKSKDSSNSPAYAGVNQTIYRCTNCGMPIDLNASFCNNCGQKIEKEQIINTEQYCTNCGAKIQAESAFCTSCGTKVE